MKKSELIYIIREEISKVLNEARYSDTVAKAIKDEAKGKSEKEIISLINNYLKQDKGNTKNQIMSLMNDDDFLGDILANVKDKKLNENMNNYMFFQNLKTIRDAVDEMLSLDPQMVDQILSDGHDWANDHVATSKDDIEEVHNFLVSRKAPMDEKKKPFPDLTGDGKVTYADVLKGRGVSLKKK